MPQGHVILDTTMPTSISSLIFLQYLTSVFDNIDEVILLFGIEPEENLRLLMANAAFNRTTGRKEDATGRLAHEVIMPKTFEVLKTQAKKVVETKRQVQFSGWFDVPRGEQAFEVKLIPVLNTMGECVQIAAIAHNVTELYKLRIENDKLQAKLKKLQS